MALARAGGHVRPRPARATRCARPATAAAGTLAAMIQPFAWPLINEHREAGRKLVMATTTPYDLVKPLADWLGFDDVIATRYGVNADGTLRRHHRRAVRVGHRQARRRARVGR